MRSLGIALALLLLAGCGDDPEPTAPAAETPPLRAAFQACEPESSRISVEDDGHTIVLDGVKEKGYADLDCLLEELGTPRSIIAQIDSTTALQGQKHAESDGLTYDWSYHPDNGVDMVISDL